MMAITVKPVGLFFVNGVWVVAAVGCKTRQFGEVMSSAWTSFPREGWKGNRYSNQRNVI